MSFETDLADSLKEIVVAICKLEKRVENIEEWINCSCKCKNYEYDVNIDTKKPFTYKLGGDDER